LVVLSARWPTLVLLVAGLVSVAAFVAASSMHVNATFLGIIDEDNEDALHFREVSTAFGGSGNLLLLVDCERLEDGRRFLTELGPELAKLDRWVKRLDARIDVTATVSSDVIALPVPLLRALSEEALRGDAPARALFMTPGLRSLIGLGQMRFAERALEAGAEQTGGLEARQVDRVIAMFEGAFESGGGDAASLDRAMAREVMRASGAEALAWTERYVREGYITSPDGRSLLATVHLKLDILDTDLGVDFFAEIEAQTRRVAAGYPGLEFGYAGAPAYGYEDQQNVLGRTRTLSVVSLILVLSMFFYIDRSLFGPLIVGLPLLLGTLWTFGLVRLFIGYVSITSAVFGILLFGLGVDFAIHIVVRYRDARAEGHDHERALDFALVRTGRGVIVGGMTSAAAFFGLLVTSQKAVRHLGLTTGFGLLCCLTAMLTVLPALLTLTASWQAEGARRQSMNLAWLTGLVRLSVARPRLTLLVVNALFVGALFQLPRARMEYDIEKIATADARALVVKRKIEERFGVATDFALCVCDDEREARAVTAALRRASTVARVESITDLLPPDPDAVRVALRELQASLRALPTSPADPLSPVGAAEQEGLSQIFAGLAFSLKAAESAGRDGFVGAGLAARAAGLKARFDAGGAESLRAMRRFDDWIVTRTGALMPTLRAGEARPLALADLPAAVRGKFVGAKGRVFVLAYPRESMFDGEAIVGFFDELEAINPEATGIGKITRLFLVNSLDELPISVLTVGLLVLSVVALDLRRPLMALLVFIPLLYASVLAVGLVVLSGQVISVLMLGGLPLILGIGVDDGVHLVHRYFEDPRRGIVEAVAETGKAIFMTSVTTMVSFGGLMLMNHHGLTGLGFLVTVGVALCFVVSVTVFPAALALLYGRSGAQGDSEGSPR
jgi:uncharacterized protein